MKKLWFAIICALVLTSSQCHAEDWGFRVARTGVDLFIARPFTFAATAIGAGVWTVTLPITLPTRTHRDAFQTMVLEPWYYTIDRPLGDFQE